MRECDVAKVVLMLGTAADEERCEALSWLQCMREERFLQDAIRDAQQAVEQPDPKAWMLRRLQNLALALHATAADLVVTRALTCAANTTLAVAAREARLNGKSMKLREDAFAYVSEFGNLKDPHNWRGHASLQALRIASGRWPSAVPVGSLDEFLEAVTSSKAVDPSGSQQLELPMGSSSLRPLVRSPFGKNRLELPSSGLRSISVRASHREASASKPMDRFDIDALGVGLSSNGFDAVYHCRQRASLFPVEKDRQGAIARTCRPTVSTTFIPFAGEQHEETVAPRITIEASHDHTIATMLSHSSQPLLEALTQAPKGCSRAQFEAAAVRNFKDLLIWMQDRVADALERHACRDAVLQRLRMQVTLNDELYLQLMKQLTHNNCPSSVSLGWQLLHTMCHTSAPSDQFIPYVDCFLEVNSQEPLEGFHGEFVNSAERCRHALRRLDRLPRLEGLLWKRSPAKSKRLARLRAFDQRWVVVRNMKVLWFRNEADAKRPESYASDGGPFCKGVINLLASECTVMRSGAADSSMFTLSPAGSWLNASATVDASECHVKDGEEDRVFTFDAKGSQHHRRRWMDVLMLHLLQARLARAHYEAPSQLRKLLHLVCSDEPSLKVAWCFVGQTLTLEDPSIEARFIQDAIESCEDLLTSAQATEPVSLRLMTETSIEDIELASLFESIAVLSGLVAALEERRATCAAESQRMVTPKLGRFSRAASTTEVPNSGTPARRFTRLDMDMKLLQSVEQ